MIMGSAAGVVAGSFLRIFARFGTKVVGHPICRKCEYDLFGRELEGGQCPECGVMLNARSVIRVGQRRKRKRLLSLGLVVMLASVLIGVFGGWRWMQTPESMKYLPVFVLKRQIASANARVADLASKELVGRVFNNRISHEQVDD